ncbi:dermatopontin-like isoform X2 [Oculina patagonica]
MADMKIAVLVLLIMITITPITPQSSLPNTTQIIPSVSTQRTTPISPQIIPSGTPQLCDSSVPGFLPWLNTWHKSFYAYCGKSNYFMSHWISYYRRCQGDRLHYFKCRPGPATGHYIQYCSWTGYLNYPTQAYFQGCANNGFIAGVISVYDPITSDRKIKLRCCRIWGYKPGQGYVQYLKKYCLSTWYRNLFGQTVLNYQVPFGYTLTGVGSFYNSYYKDRRWRFQICKMQN